MLITQGEKTGDQSPATFSFYKAEQWLGHPADKQLSLDQRWNQSTSLEAGKTTVFLYEILQTIAHIRRLRAYVT
jgi:hypothetical protein